MHARERPLHQPSLGVTTFTTNCAAISKRTLSDPAELQSLEFKPFRAMHNSEIAVEALLARKSDGSLTAGKEPGSLASGFADDPGTR